MNRTNDKQIVWVTIRGTQMQDGDTEVTETLLCTQAHFYRRKGKIFIIYDESEATGYEGCRTMLTVEGARRLTMTRSGQMRSGLVLECGKRHLGFYALPGGELQIGVNTSEITGCLTDFGGELFCRYRLDINALPMSENTLHIKVELHKPEGR